MTKPKILLLHGALGTATSMQAIAQELDSAYEVLTLNFPGHGGEAIPEVGITLQSLTDALNSFIHKNTTEPIAVFGYSMGGYVALHAAAKGNTKIKNITTLATKMHWDTPTAMQENAKLNPDILLEKVPQFVAALEKIHAPTDWRLLLAEISHFLTELGENNPLKPSVLEQISIPVLYLVGDADKTVSIAETEAAAEATPLGKYKVLPNTPHALEKADAGVVAKII